MDAVLRQIGALYAPDRLLLLAQIVLGGFAAFAVLERLFPARPPNARGFLVSLRCSIAYQLIAPAAAVVPTVAVFQLLQGLQTTFWPVTLNMQVFAYWLDAPPSPVGYVPSVGAAVLFTMLGLLVIDFGYYWFHRLQHAWPALWEQHKLHHSDAHLSVATSYRHHWLEDALRAFIVTLPMGLVFNFTPVQIAWLAYVVPQFGHFIHANLRIGFGPLSPLLVSPQLHRIHHSIEPGHRDKNFAAFFPLWDIVFGTYYRPARGEFPETGVPGEASAVTWREMLVGPFSAWTARARSFSGAAWRIARSRSAR